MTHPIQEPAIVAHRERCLLRYRVFNQGVYWFPSGRPPTPIAEMADTHRWNTTKWLMRHAKQFEEIYAWGELYAYTTPALQAIGSARPLSEFETMGDHARDRFDGYAEWRQGHPQEWIRQTKLYEALLEGLPNPHSRTGRKRLGRLVMRARHYSTCPRNRRLNDPECTCRQEQ